MLGSALIKEHHEVDDNKWISHDENSAPIPTRSHEIHDRDDVQP